MEYNSGRVRASGCGAGHRATAAVLFYKKMPTVCETRERRTGPAIVL